MKKRGLSVSKSTCQPRQPVSLMNLSFTACLTKSYPPWGKNFLVLRMRSSRVSSLYFRLFCRQSEKPKPETQASGETRYPDQKTKVKKKRTCKKNVYPLHFAIFPISFEKLLKLKEKFQASGGFSVPYLGTTPSDLKKACSSRASSTRNQSKCFSGSRKIGILFSKEIQV